MEKTSKALVKGVLSGDTLILSGKIPKNSSKPEDEPYGFESKEYLRNLLIGKVINYKIDYSQNERNYGQIFYNDKNINFEIIKNGFAKIGFLPKSQDKIYNSDYWKSY